MWTNITFSNLRPEALHQYLDQHHNVHCMCYLPIHTAMVCFLFDTLEADLPQTETEIYKEFTKSTILRILYRSNPEIFINSVDDLTELQREIYDKICKLAYEMCKSSKQVITQAETQFFDMQVDDNSLGLITTDKMATRCGFQHMYTFLHLTFQEFLCASYISRLEKDQQLKLIIQLGKAKQMQQVWKFYCGLTKFDADCKMFKAIVSNLEYGDLFLVQCCFESQQSHVCDTIVKDNALTFSDNFLSPSNFTEIAFVLSNANHYPVLSLSFEACVFGQECVDVFVEKVTKDKLSLLTTLCYHCRDLEQVSVLKYLLQSLPSLKIFDISDLLWGIDELECLTKNFSHTNLHIFKVGTKLPVTIAKLFSTCSLFNVYYSGSDKNHVIHNFPSNSHSGLTCAKVNHLTRRLASIPFLVTRLTLSGCSIDDEGASSLVSGLSLCHCSELEVLELSINNIGDNGAIAIANGSNFFTKLSLLDLTHNNLSDDGALVLANTFKCGSVKILLSFNGITRYDDILKSSDVDFHKLDYSTRNLGDAGIDWLASFLLTSCECSDILQFNLSMNNLFPLGMKFLSSVLVKCSNLLILDLSFNELGDSGAFVLSGALEHCVKLHNLDVSSNCISSKGARAIAEYIKCCTNLLHLKVSFNTFGSEGTRALIDALKHCVILQELELKSNNIQFGGAMALARAFSLQYWTHFYVLDVSSNNIASEGIRALSEALVKCTTLQRLSVSNNSIQKDDADSLAMCFKNFKTFQVLDISCNNLESSGAEVIADALLNSTSLYSLNISSNKIGQDGAYSLANALQHWANLSELNISSNGIESQGLEYIALAMKSTKSLSHLDISGNALSSFNNQAVMNLFKQFLNISELHLSNNYVDESILSALTDSLAYCKNLQVLDINSCQMGKSGVKILAKGLAQSTQLSQLYISNNHIGNAGAIVLADALTHLNYLQVLDVSKNRIEDKGAIILMETIESGYSRPLHEFNLSQNSLKVNHGIIKLARTVQQSRAICSLIISGISLASDGAKVLADGLKHCINLQKLDISSNSIGADGAEALSEALKCCTALNFIDISCNPIENKGGYAFAGVFKYCVHLHDINFSECEICCNLVIFEALQHCHNII